MGGGYGLRVMVIEGQNSSFHYLLLVHKGQILHS
jgi:hypothetical protein